MSCGTCPVCFGKDNLVQLGCSHCICRECLPHLTSCVCPTCRASLTIEEIGEETIKTIMLNNIQSKKSQEEDDLRELIETIRTENNERRYTVEDMKKRLECELAFRYLREIGVPERYIPVDISVKSKIGEPSQQTGSLFSLIVRTVWNEVEKDMGDESFSVSESEEI